MFIDIQKTITELKAEQEMAFKKWGYHRYYNRPNKAKIYLSVYDAISECINKLTLLLNSENEKQQSKQQEDGKHHVKRSTE